MTEEPFYILFLDAYHAGDVLFLQSLSRAMARRAWSPAPIVVHGSGEHAERLLESHGIFRSRSGGVLQIESAREHALVERALRSLNRKIVAILTDAVVASVGVIGAQRNVFAVDGEELRAPGASRVQEIAAQGVVPVVAANARHEGTEATGEPALTQAVDALARALQRARQVEIVLFTTTNLPGVMHGGSPKAEAEIEELRGCVADPEALAALVESGRRVLVTNSNRLSDPEGPVGSRIGGRA